MLKHLIVLVVLSFVVVFFMSNVEYLVKYLLMLHEAISTELGNVFYDGTVGNLIKDLIALLALPLIAGLIPALIYWVVKRHWFPYFMEVVWIVWLIQIGALVMYRVS